MDIQALVAQEVAKALAAQTAQAAEAPIELDIAPAPAVTISAPGKQVILRKSVRQDDGTYREVETTGFENALDQALADGWEVVDQAQDENPPLIQPEPPAELPEAALATDLETLMEQRGPLFYAIFRYLEAEVRGKVPEKKRGKGLERRREGEIGEILPSALHRHLLESGVAIGCKKEGCIGNHRDCPVREAIRMLAAQPDVPIRLAKRRRGFWGHLYIYSPPE